MSPAEPRCTAIVVTWNSAPDLGRCLESLGAMPVVVVDNASGDDSVAVAQAHGATVLAQTENVGFPRACNIGLAAVETPFVFLCNPDVAVAQDAVTRCVAELAADESIGIVGPNTVRPGGRPEQPAARRDLRALHVVLDSLGLTVLHPSLDLQRIHDRSHDRDVPAVNGAAMFLRTDVLRRLGGLDEHVFLFFEDMDLCRRVRDAGLRVRFLAGARATHGNGTSIARGDTDQRDVVYLHRLDGQLEFLRIHGHRWEPQVAVLALLARCALGMAVTTVHRTDRRTRYRRAFRWLLGQFGGRQAPPPVR